LNESFTNLEKALQTYSQCLKSLPNLLKT